MTLDLPYSFFYDLQVLKQSGGNDGTPNVPVRRRRKRRQMNESILQRVDIVFRPVEVGASVLLHSESQRYIHQLMVSTYNFINLMNAVLSKINDMILKLNCSDIGLMTLHMLASCLCVITLIISLLLHPYLGVSPLPVPASSHPPLCVHVCPFIQADYRAINFS